MEMKNLLLAMAIVAWWSFMGVPFEAQAVEEGYYDAFISVNDNVDLTQLRNAGLKITARYDGIITAEVPNNYMPSDLRNFSGILSASRSIPILTYSDSARYLSHADAVHLGERLDMPYDGSGIIVGVIDCGFDFNHVNFWDENGNTRVKAVYLPFNNTGRTIMVNRIVLPGTCFETPERILALTTDDPATTHGTQTAGIAAGSYRDNGWYGIAPGVDIVACGMPEGELNDVKLAHCISYIDDYAKRMGKPYVVNISMGCNVGAHDGTSYLSTVIKQFSGPGRVFVVSAGNDGDEPVCIHESLKTKTDTVTALLNGYAKTGGRTRSGCVNAWSKGATPFNSKLIVVDTRTRKIVYQSRSLGTTTTGVTEHFDTETDAQLAEFYTGTMDFSGTIEEGGHGSSLITLNMTAKESYYIIGVQYYSPLATDLSIWTSQYAYFNTYGFNWVSSGTSVGSINELATSDSVISVGSYNSKQYVPLRDGSLYFRPDSEPLQMSYYSSYGPDENGVSRPDVCAPGSVVISSANRYDTHPHNLQYWQPSAYVNGVEYPFCPDLGTSMSAPVVTGAIALWLQANPNLSAADVRNVLKHSSYKDSYVTRGNPERWGSGKLDIEAGMRYVLHIEDKNGDVNGDGEVNLSDINVVIDIILGGSYADDVMRRADVNSDGEIGVSDINMIIDIILS